MLAEGNQERIKSGACRRGATGIQEQQNATYKSGPFAQVNGLTGGAECAKELTMPSWQLEDADPIAAAHPYTFYKPSREVIDRVCPGEVVKLIFCFNSEDPEAPRAERMWVLVEERLPDGSFRGRLDNHPRHIRDLQADDPICFRPCHVISTEHDDQDNLVERYAKRCFVTRRVLDEGRPVAYLYREDPDDEDDSGWRITAGDESDAYMEDSANVAYVSLGAVLSRDDSFRGLLEVPAGSAFSRNPQTGEFVPEAAPDASTHGDGG